MAETNINIFKKRMLMHGAMSTRCSTICHKQSLTHLVHDTKGPKMSPTYAVQQIAAATLATTAAVFVLSAGAIEASPQQSEDTLSNIRQTLRSVCTSPVMKDCEKRYKIQHPKSKKAEKCTSTKCAGTCLLGGFGSPGEGPFNIMRPLVVFKEGFRSRKYCLSECSDICNLIGDGDYNGP